MTPTRGEGGVKGEALERSLRRAIRDIPDFPKPGIVFKDITPILADPKLFEASIAALADFTSEMEADVVAGVDARGFLFAAPVALRLGLGLVPVRKSGKLPFDTHAASYELEYGTNTIEIHTDAVGSGGRVVVIDDLLATGGTVRATTELIERCGGSVAGIGFLIELGFLGGRDVLDGYRCMSLVTYE